MKDWLENLAPRERLIVGAGIVAAIIIILWGFVLRPLGQNRVELADQVDAKTRLLVDLERARAVANVDGGRASGAAGANESILLIIDGSARTFGLADSFTQTRPNGSNEISVSFQRAPFDTLVAWLVDLESSYGISVDAVSMTSAGMPGLVNGQIFLERG
jgi:type II secretory pathway component PulM